MDVLPGETLGLVGESGSGKTTFAKTILGIIAPDKGGELELEGKNLAARVGDRRTDERRAIQIVFQNPDSALNRSHTVRQLVGRALSRLTPLRGREREERLQELAASVRLRERYLTVRPSALSGGLKQRVAIARAFAGDPELVVCDEPTSALDVSVQAAILNLLADLQREKGVSYLFISHDLGVVRYLSDRIAVLYLGRLMELGPAEVVFDGPHHPYTEALLSAVPEVDGTSARIRLEGDIPSVAEPPSGCVFHTRCPRFLGDDLREPGAAAGGGRAGAPCALPHPGRRAPPPAGEGRADAGRAAADRRLRRGVQRVVPPARPLRQRGADALRARPDRGEQLLPPVDVAAPRGAARRHRQERRAGRCGDRDGEPRQAVLELVDGRGIALLAHLGEVAAEGGPIGDRVLGDRRERRCGEVRLERVVGQRRQGELAGRRGVQREAAPDPVRDADEARRVDLGHDLDGGRRRVRGQRRRLADVLRKDSEMRAGDAHDVAEGVGGAAQAHDGGPEHPVVRRRQPLHESEVGQRREQPAGGRARQLGRPGERGGGGALRPLAEGLQQRSAPLERLVAAQARRVAVAHRHALIVP